MDACPHHAAIERQLADHEARLRPLEAAHVEQGHLAEEIDTIQHRTTALEQEVSSMQSNTLVAAATSKSKLVEILANSVAGVLTAAMAAFLMYLAQHPPAEAKPQPPPPSISSTTGHAP